MAYPKLGTTVYIDSVLFGVVKAQPSFPGLTGPDDVDTTPQAPTANMKTHVTNGLMGISGGEIVVFNYPGAFTAIQVLIAGGAKHDVEIRQTDGQSQYYDAAHGGGATFHNAKLGGISGAGDTEFPSITFEFHPTGNMAVEATTGDWWDAVDFLAFAGGDFGITALTSPKTVVMIAGLAASGFAAIVPNADIDFLSDTPATATIGANTGVVTRIGNGDTILSASISGAPTITASALCTAT